jgi:flagellar hook assembly protein FlgD
MKKIYLLFTLSICGYSYSQNSVGIGTINNTENKTRNVKSVELAPRTNHLSGITTTGKTQSAVDTAGIEFMDDSVTVYGYVANSVPWPFFGANTYADKAFAQVYPYFGSSAMNVEQVLIKFAAKFGTASGNLTVKVYNVASGFPTTTIQSASLSFANIDTVGFGDNYTVITLPTAASVTTHFAAGIDVTPFYTATSVTGTAMIYSTLEGEPHGSTNAKIMGSDNAWGNVTIWTGLTDVNFAILPVVNASYATSIDKTEEINGIKLTQSYPNPSKDFAKIEYVINENANVALEIIDMTGKVVMTSNEEKQITGKHEILLNTSTLSAGKYFYSLSANGKRVTKSMIIE